MGWNPVKQINALTLRANIYSHFPLQPPADDTFYVLLIFPGHPRRGLIKKCFYTIKNMISISFMQIFYNDMFSNIEKTLS